MGGYKRYDYVKLIKFFVGSLIYLCWLLFFFVLRVKLMLLKVKKLVILEVELLSLRFCGKWFS